MIPEKPIENHVNITAKFGVPKQEMPWHQKTERAAPVLPSGDKLKKLDT